MLLPNFGMPALKDWAVLDFHNKCVTVGGDAAVWVEGETAVIETERHAASQLDQFLSLL
jgi:hypothetical protein